MTSPALLFEPVPAPPPSVPGAPFGVREPAEAPALPDLLGPVARSDELRGRIANRWSVAVG